jgi:glycosyltransferase involved in cell wall biosynthesis
MKLIIQVPCYNEEDTLPLVINSIPKKIEGVDVIETLIIDDGSTDKTIEVARKLGVNHIVRHKRNQGLASSFSDGMEEALKQGADIIVNTDGDNQYPQEDIGRLIEPILKGTHDIVIGNRQVHTIEHFSPLKKFLQKIGSTMVRYLSGVHVPDAPSGFRAYSRHAAMSMNIVSTFSYVIETIIQAGEKRLAITHVPVKTNPKTRESRLFRNIFEHVRKSTVTMFRIYIMYSPFKIFFWGGTILIAIGTIPFIRIAYLTIQYGDLVSGHIQSMILGALFVIVGLLVLFLGVISDLLSINRKLTEQILFKSKKAALSHSK